MGLVSVKPPSRLNPGGVRGREPSSVVALLARETRQLELDCSWVSPIYTPEVKATPRLETEAGPIHPAAVEAEDFDDAYEFVTRWLWFAYHGMSPIGNTAESVDGLEKTRRVADAVAETASRNLANRPILVNDYQLSLVPRLIRERGADRGIAHMSFTPIAPRDSWIKVPPEVRKAVLEGILGSDLAGFTVRKWADRFVEAVLMDGMGVWDQTSRSINHAGGRTQVGVYPVFASPKTLREILASGRRSTRPDGCRFMFVRAERLDPVKNAVRGFEAFELVLEKAGADWEELHYAAVLSPTRTKMDRYNAYRRRVEEVLLRIESRFPGSISVCWEEDHPLALSLARDADAIVVNSVADGMNLFAQEAVIVNERDGMLLLSSEAGSAEVLGADSLLLKDPLSTSATFRAMESALEIAPPDRRRRSSRAAVSLAAAETSFLRPLLADLEAITASRPSRV